MTLELGESNCGRNQDDPQGLTFYSLALEDGGLYVVAAV